MQRLGVGTEAGHRSPANAMTLRSGAETTGGRGREAATPDSKNSPIARSSAGLDPKIAAEVERRVEAAWQALRASVSQGTIHIPPPVPNEQPLDMDRRDSAALIVRYWAIDDSAAAAAWCMSLPECPMKSACLQEVGLIQAANDPAAAVEWAKNLPLGASRDSAIEALGWETSSNDPLGALNLAIDMPEGDARTRLLQHAAAVWAESDPESAANWAKQIAVPDLSAQALAAVVTAWAARDPASAAAAVAADFPTGLEQQRAAVAVVQRWAQQDPAATAQWVASFPPGATAEAVAGNLVSQWAQSSGPDAPWQWLSSLPLSGARDAGFAALARSQAISNPQLAARCFAQISGNPKRF